MAKSTPLTDAERDVLRLLGMRRFHGLTRAELSGVVETAKLPMSDNDLADALLKLGRFGLVEGPLDGKYKITTKGHALLQA